MGLVLGAIEKVRIGRRWDKIKMDYEKNFLKYEFMNIG